MRARRHGHRLGGDGAAAAAGSREVLSTLIRLPAMQRHLRATDSERPGRVGRVRPVVRQSPLSPQVAALFDSVFLQQRQADSDMCVCVCVTVCVCESAARSPSWNHWTVLPAGPRPARLKLRAAPNRTARRAAPSTRTRPVPIAVTSDGTLVEAVVWLHLCRRVCVCVSL